MEKVEAVAQAEAKLNEISQQVGMVLEQLRVVQERDAMEFSEPDDIKLLEAQSTSDLPDGFVLQGVEAAAPRTLEAIASGRKWDATWPLNDELNLLLGREKQAQFALDRAIRDAQIEAGGKLDLASGTLRAKTL